MAMVIAVLLTLLAAGGDGLVPAPAVAHAAAHPNRWSEPTRGILALRCGQCHLPNLPTSVPGALAVFDLTEEPWHGRLDHEQLDALLRRVRGTGEITDADEAIVERFVLCARDGVCPTDGP